MAQPPQAGDLEHPISRLDRFHHCRLLWDWVAPWGRFTTALALQPSPPGLRCCQLLDLQPTLLERHDLGTPARPTRVDADRSRARGHRSTAPNPTSQTGRGAGQPPAGPPVFQPDPSLQRTGHPAMAYGYAATCPPAAPVLLRSACCDAAWTCLDGPHSRIPFKTERPFMNAAMERYDESQREEQRLRERGTRQMDTIRDYMAATEREDRPPSGDVLVHLSTALKTLRRVASEARQQHELGTQALRDSSSTMRLKHHAEEWEEFQEAVDRSESIAETLQAMIDQYNQQQMHQAAQAATMVSVSREDDFARRPAPPTPAPQPSLDAELLRLPKHELPKFAGTCVDWPVFWNQFRIAVDDRQIPSIHKFVYLRSCLSGEALDLVKALLIVDSSYSTALTLLRQRFEDTRVLLRDHIEALLNAPQAVPNNPASLAQIGECIPGQVYRVGECRRLNRIPVPDAPAHSKAGWGDASSVGAGADVIRQVRGATSFTGPGLTRSAWS